ncbi:glycerate kinase [Arthrobacter terricola]|uniref:glycerate kinase n=1 Tax=Arthrobacter terricola TaxID=2547396 RepID=UPI00197AF3C9|nr:glycerate kinase [Arthrobacter terricola]
MLVAPDAFKSSLSAAEAARHLAAGVAGAGADCTTVQCPIADGGEGTIAVLESLGADIRRTVVNGALGHPVPASWAAFDGTAYIEVAQGAGAHHVPVRTAQTCLRAASTGVGQLISAALDAGHRKIVLTTGGSAVSDGGAGMLHALGAEFSPDDAGSAGGGALSWICGVDLSTLDPRLQEADITVAVDVNNPLLGDAGAAKTFAPQKGAGPREIELLEAGLAHWADLIDRDGSNRSREPGSGASGGIGFAAMSALGARRVSGADMVLDLLRIDALLGEADLLVTGEGSLDSQSLFGKAPLSLAARAAAHRVPVVVVAGRVELPPSELLAYGISASWSLVELAGSTAAALEDPCRWLQEAGRLVAAQASQLA